MNDCERCLMIARYQAECRRGGCWDCESLTCPNHPEEDPCETNKHGKNNNAPSSSAHVVGFKPSQKHTNPLRPARPKS